MKQIIPSEHHEQCLFTRYCKVKKIPMFAIPNGTFLNGNKLQRSKQMNRLKSEGLKVGVPDTFIPIASNGFHGLFIEMKRKKGSVTSEEQKEWLELLNNQGYKAVICKGADEAIKVTDDYLQSVK